MESIARFDLESIDFSMASFLAWAIVGATLFAVFYKIAGRLAVAQHFSVYAVTVPGALLCGIAAGVFGASCGLIPPVLYAGMLLGEYLLKD